MVLRITDSEEDFGITSYKVSLAAFAMKEYHPMIATTQWDRVYIDCNEKTPRGIIKQLIDTTKVIPVFDKSNVTPRVLQLLCEVAPDQTAALKSAYMKGAEAFNAVISDLEERRWGI